MKLISDSTTTMRSKASWRKFHLRNNLRITILWTMIKKMTMRIQMKKSSPTTLSLRLKISKRTNLSQRISRI